MESDHDPSKEVSSRAGHLPYMLSAQGQIEAARSVQTPNATETFIRADPQPARLRKQEVGPALLNLYGLPLSAAFIFLLI